MGSRFTELIVDCADPNRLAAFWAAALGYETDEGSDEWVLLRDPAGAGPMLGFQQVPEGKVAKNRVHLDVRAAPGLRGAERMAALEDECARLVALGATRVRRVEPEPPMSEGFIVMTDPEGNEFCLD